MLNGMTVITRNKTAIYMRIPREMQVAIDGGCSCDHCKANPGLAKWDTLVVESSAPNPRKSNDFCFTVHMPDAQVQEFIDYCKRTGK